MADERPNMPDEADSSADLAKSPLDDGADAGLADRDDSREPPGESDSVRIGQAADAASPDPVDQHGGDESDAEADGMVHDDADGDGNEESPEEDAELALDPDAVKQMASVCAMMEDEGYAVEENGAMILEFAAQLSSDTEELQKVLKETDVIRKRSQEFAKIRGLTKATMPWGKTRPDEACDAVPFHHRGCLPELGLLAEQLDSIAELQEGESQDSEALHAVKRQAKANIAALLDQHEEPRKVVYNERRRDAWFLLQHERENPASDAYVRDQVRNQFQSLYQLHKETLQQLREHYTPESNKPMPDIGQLLDDLSELEKSMGMPIDGYQEFFDASELQKFKLFTAGVRALIDERIISASGGTPRVRKTARWEELAQAIQAAPNFGVVFDKQRMLTYGLERVLILHWVTENLCKSIRRKNSEVVEQAKSNAERAGQTLPGNPDWISVGILVRAIEDVAKLQLKFLKDALRQRNNICHRGDVWDSNAFLGLVQDYQGGIGLITESYNVDLHEIKVKAEKRKSLDYAEMLNRVKQYFEDKELDYDLAKSLIQPDIESQVREWAKRNADIVSSVQRLIFMYLEKELDLPNRMFVETALKAGLTKSQTYGCRANIFSAVAKRREFAERMMQRIAKWKRTHGE